MLLVLLFAWMLAAKILFAAGGTLQDAAGDGLITHQIRLLSKDDKSFVIFGLLVIILFYGSVFWLLRKMYIVGVQDVQAQPPNKKPQTHLRKYTEASLVTLLLAAYIYAMFPIPIKPFTGRDDVASNLYEIAAEINQTMPQELDSVTTIVKATAEGRTLTYHYKIKERRGTDEAFIRYVRENVIYRVCLDFEMRESMRVDSVTYRYSYMFPDSQAPIFVDANQAECLSLGIAF